MVIYEVRQNRDSFSAKMDAGIFYEIQRAIRYLDKERLSAIAVSIGPGMFTSLRVGLSITKGLSISLNIPVVAVNTLDAIGQAGSRVYSPLFYNCPHYIMVVINAYQEELYSAIYKQGLRISEYLLTTAEDLLNILKNIIEKEPGPVIVLGPGASLLKNQITNSTARLIFPTECSFLTSAHLIPIALPLVEKQNFTAPEFLEPFYIKKSPAEK
ncbi:MAG: tRNA (adenosine(37)-N6)-threonylcarbamoyltransferase complex dimerization subunit type 1 TsaB [candidate division WOR-3 bacterium]